MKSDLNSWISMVALVIAGLAGTAVVLVPVALVVVGVSLSANVTAFAAIEWFTGVALVAGALIIGIWFAVVKALGRLRASAKAAQVDTSEGNVDTEAWPPAPRE